MAVGRGSGREFDGKDLDYHLTNILHITCWADIHFADGKGHKYLGRRFTNLTPVASPALANHHRKRQATPTLENRGCGRQIPASCLPEYLARFGHGTPSPQNLGSWLAGNKRSLETTRDWCVATARGTVDLGISEDPRISILEANLGYDVDVGNGQGGRAGDAPTSTTSLKQLPPPPPPSALGLYLLTYLSFSP